MKSVFQLAIEKFPESITLQAAFIDGWDSRAMQRLELVSSQPEPMNPLRARAHRLVDRLNSEDLTSLLEDVFPKQARSL